MDVMLALLLPLLGFAFLDSLNVLNLGLMALIVYDSRLSRRSPVPAGLSFAGGLVTATATVGICVVVGLTYLTDRIDFEMTPTVRYWGQLGLGLVLMAVAGMSSAGPTPPKWALAAAHRKPWLFGVVGFVVGLGQGATSVPYLTAMAMVSARDPRPTAWPVIVIAYCAIALVPSLLVLGLATRKSTRARRVQRSLVRGVTHYGPRVIRVLFLGIGLVLVVNALLHYAELW